MSTSYASCLRLQAFAHLILNTALSNALREISSERLALTTEFAGGAADLNLHAASCISRDCTIPDETAIHGDEHFRLKAGDTAWSLNAGMRFFVSSEESCDGRVLGEVTAVPQIDKGPDPVHLSWLDFFVNRTEPWSNMPEGGRAFLCASQSKRKPDSPANLSGKVRVQTQRARCLCNITLAAPVWTLAVVAPGARFPSAVEGRLEEMNELCPSWAIRLCEVFTLASLLLMITACVHAIAVSKTLEPKEDAPPINPSPEWIIPTPAEDAKKWTPQAVLFVLNIVALHQILFFVMLKEMSLYVACFVVAWPATFGIVGLVRIICSMCKGQLVHAALLHGVCIREPPGTGFSIKTLVLGIFLLTATASFSVGGDKELLGLIAVALTVAQVALGPALSALKPFSLVSEEDKLVWNTIGKASLLAFDGKQRALEGVEKADSATFTLSSQSMHQTLQQGTMQFVTMAEFLRAARAVPDKTSVLSTIEVSATNDAPDSHGPDTMWDSFNLLDLRWQTHFVYSCTGSKMPFITLPLTVFLVIVLAAATVFQGVNIACMHPALEDFQVSLGTMTPSFGSRQHRYALFLEQTYRSIALHASADTASTSTMDFTLPGQARDAVANSTLSALRAAAVRDSYFPEQSFVHVSGLLGQSSWYAIDIFPTRVLPTSVLFSITYPSGVFQRCVPWAELYRTVVSLPEVSSQQLQIEVAFADHVVGLPLPQDRKDTHDGDETGLRTVFERRSWSEATDPLISCRQMCQDSRRCLDTYYNEHGCFFIETPQAIQTSVAESLCFGEHVQQLSTRSWNSERKVSGWLQSMNNMHTTVGGRYDSNAHLQFLDVPASWLQGLIAELQFSFRHVIGDAEVGGRNERVKVATGTPSPKWLLVNVTGELQDMKGAIQINATGTVNQSGFLIVTIEKYDPSKLTSLSIAVAPLLLDTKFEMRYPDHMRHTGVQVMGDTGEVPIFSACETQPFLKARFPVCQGNRLDQVLRLKMSPWEPPAVPFRMQVVAVNAEDARHGQHFSTRELEPLAITFEGVDKPAAWAITENCAADKAVVHMPMQSASTPQVLCTMMRFPSCTIVDHQMKLTKASSDVVSAVLAVWGAEKDSRGAGAQDIVAALRCMRERNDTRLPGKIDKCLLNTGSVSAAYRFTACLHLDTRQKTLMELVPKLTSKKTALHGLPLWQVKVQLFQFVLQSTPEDAQHPRVDALLDRACEIVVKEPLMRLPREEELTKQIRGGISAGKVHGTDLLAKCFRDHYQPLGSGYPQFPSLKPPPFMEPVFAPPDLRWAWFNPKVLSTAGVIATKRFGFLAVPRSFFGASDDSLSEPAEHLQQFQSNFIKDTLRSKCDSCVQDMVGKRGKPLVMKYVTSVQNSVADQDVIGLVGMLLPVLPEVVQIELSCWTSSSGCKATSSLWKGLASLSQLRKVSLHAVQVSHADEAAEALKAHPGLTELRLAFAGLDDLKFTDERRRVEEPGVEPIHPLQKFANALGAQPYPKLALLSLEGNSIGEEGGKKVAEALHRLPSLRQLHLLDIGEEGANAVARALMPLQNLSVLSVHASIEHWEMGAFRIISCWGFAQALADKKQLLSLAFNGHQIGADCVDALSKKVLRSQRLTDLNLKDNNISSRGVSILGELIESGNGLKKLRTLDVTANSIMSEGATAIAKALLALRSLEVVHLDDNDIEDEGCRELASALRKLKMMPPFQVKLKELTFAENPCLSGEAGEELQEAWDAFQRRALPGSKIPKPGKRGPRRPAGDGQKGLIVPGRLFPMFREPEIPGAEEMSVGEADDWDESWA